MIKKLLFTVFLIFSSFVAVQAQSETAITSFTVPGGSTTIGTGTVDIDVPFGTDVTALIATFGLSAGASADVGGTPQVSGTTPNDFTLPVVYTVTAADDTTTQDWTVTVTILPAAASITMTTTSSLAAWSLATVTKSGDPLTWTATGASIAPQVSNANVPLFDFSANDGSDINITVTSTDGFSGLTGLIFGGSADLISTIDVSEATALEVLNMRFQLLASIDLTQNTELTELYLSGSQQLTSGTLDISNNTQLETLWLDLSQLTAIDVSSNTLLTDVRLQGTSLNSVVLDQLVIDLDTHGESNGNLQINGTPKSLTYVAYEAYNNLIDRGWSIDASSPPAPDVKSIVLTTTSTSSTWSPSSIINSGATLKWTVTGGVEIDEIVENDPILDLSANLGVATITITSDEAFANFTDMIFEANSGITSIDATNATALVAYNVRYNNVTALDVTTMPSLIFLTVRGNTSFAGPLDISNNPNLTLLFLDETIMTTIDVSNNPLLDHVLLNDAAFTSDVLDKVVIDLDRHGLSNGRLRIADNAGDLTSAAYIAYNNLITKGWDIDVTGPQVVSLSPIVYLQGPLLSPDDAGLMNDDLRQAGYLPTTSPYSDALTVNASVFDDGGSSGSGADTDDIVDWVWVELRDAGSNSTIISSRSALLQRDGDVVALDGISPLPMDAVDGNYFVTVNHRNHLGIMSATSITLTSTPATVDLSSSIATVFGGANAVVDMGSSIFAMFGGDSNGNENVQNTDISPIILENGTSSYSNSDLDMNGQIQNTDMPIIYPNNGRGQQF